MSNQNDTYFTCGVNGCAHIQPVDRPEDLHRFQICKDHMVRHYKFDHAPLIGTRVGSTYDFSDRYEFRPIPDAIGPTLTDNDDTYTWAEVKKYFD